MSNVDVTAPKQRIVGRPFPKGVSGNPAGRPVGARGRLSSSFVNDLAKLWEEQGPDVLARVARDDPAALLKVIASLTPKDINISGNLDLGVNPQDLLASFRTAVAALGNDPDRLPRPMKVINAGRS
jgi:hypothetical protein